MPKDLDKQLTGTLAEIAANLRTERLRKKARKVLRSAAGKIRKIAVGNLTRSSLDADMKSLSRCVRSYVGKDLGGFGVSVASSGKGKGMYRSSRKSKNGKTRYIPLAVWAEEGTEERRRGPKALVAKYTKKKGYRFVRAGKRSGLSTGSMPAYGFMKKAEGRISSVIPDIEKGFEDIVDDIIKTNRYD